MVKLSSAKIISTFILCCVTIFFLCDSAQSQSVSETPKSIEQEYRCIPPPEGYVKSNNTKEYQELMSSVLTNNPIFAEKFSDHKIRVLRAILEENLEESVDDSVNDSQTTPLVSLVVFDYTMNKTHFFIVNGRSGRVIRSHTLFGRPQPSPEEIEAASEIVKADPSLTNFLQNNAQIIGGFIVDGPAKSPEDHRYMQMRIVTPDMRNTKKVVIVDLSADKVVSK